MRASVNWNGETVTLTVFNLCSQQGVGDYEGFGDHELSLDLPGISQRLNDLGYIIDGVNEQICLAQKDRLQLTLFPNGRIIVEGVKPDDPKLALAIMAEAFGFEPA
jgi:hypothetical protein